MVRQVSFVVLLPLQAYKANVICPNKHQSDPEKFYNHHLLESETYIGGHVECLESGVFRSDIPTSFKLDPSAYEVCSFFICLYNLKMTDSSGFKKCSSYISTLSAILVWLEPVFTKN